MSDAPLRHRLPEWKTVADVAAMKVFSLVTADPNPIHWDVAEVAARGLGDRAINQGGLNLAYVLDAIDAWTEAGRPRSVRVRFVGNVFDGDAVRVEGEVSAVDEDDILMNVRLIGSAGKPVVEGSARVRRNDEERS